MAAEPENGLRRGRPPVISADAIIRAARDEGLAEFTMLAIAKRLNITHGALYRYFLSRDALALAVVDTIIEEAHWDHSPASWRLLLVRFAQALWVLCSDTRGFAECVLTLHPKRTSMTRILKEHIATLEGCGVRSGDAAVAVELISDEVLLTSMLRGGDNGANIAPSPLPEKTHHQWSGEAAELEQKLALILDGIEHRLSR